MKVAFDLDGTLDSSEGVRKLAKKLHDAGKKVVVLTGTSNPDMKEAKAEKKLELARLGVDYDKLRIFPNPPHAAKVAWCEKHDVSLLIDNSMTTAQLAPHGLTVLVPWRTLSN